MTDPLPLARLRQIVEAYGADPRRWPADERDAALALLRTDPDAGALMDMAGETDDLLAAFVLPRPSPALRATVLASAPSPSPVRRLRLWWAALALALAGGGGMLAGSAASAALAPAALITPVWDNADATAFGDLSADEV